MPRLRFAAAFLLLGPFAPAAAQQLQPLGRPLVEYPEPFSRISGVRELADGRLIIADSREKTLQLIDLSTGASRTISREGRGPGEYLTIATLLPMPNDQTLVTDMGNRRFLRLGPDGAVIETISLPDLTMVSAAAGEPAMMQELGSLSLMLARAADQWGRLYFQRASMRLPGTVVPDSGAILRWTVGQPRVDSAGWVRLNGSGQMFAPQELWQVSPTGGIIRVLPDPYRLLAVDSLGRRTLGPAIAYTPIRVTAAERKAIEAQRAGAMQQVMRAQSQATGRAVSGAPASGPQITFAAEKPPVDGPIAVAPDGQVWALRSRADGDDVPVYDVFSPAGQVLRRVSLAPRSRLLGFGQRTVYIARVDEDDLEWLQKYGRP